PVVGGRHVRGVVHRAAGGGGGGRCDVHVLAGSGADAAEGAGEDAAGDRAAGAAVGRVDRPGEPGVRRQRIGHGDATGGSGAVVRGGDDEADRLARAHGALVGGLRDGDVGAIHRDGG